MSTGHSLATPASHSKKRELTSPVFEIDTKKNKVVLGAERSEATSGVDISPDNTESEMADSGCSTGDRLATSRITILFSSINYNY